MHSLKLFKDTFVIAVGGGESSDKNSLSEPVTLIFVHFSAPHLCGNGHGIIL